MAVLDCPIAPLSKAEARAALRDTAIYDHEAVLGQVAGAGAGAEAPGPNDTCVVFAHPTRAATLVPRGEASRKMDDFLAKFPSIVRGVLIRRRNEAGLLLAGGAASCALNTLSPTPGDIDLFPVGIDAEEVRGYLASIADSFGPSWTVERTERCVTFIRGELKLQVVLRAHKTVGDVLNNFDMGSSQVAYLPGRPSADGQFLFTDAARVAFTRGLNIVNLARRSPSFEYRLAKYYERGFGLALADHPGAIAVRHAAGAGTVLFHNLEIHMIASIRGHRFEAAAIVVARVAATSSYECAPGRDSERMFAAVARAGAPRDALVAVGRCAAGVDVTAINPEATADEAARALRRAIPDVARATLETLTTVLDADGCADFARAVSGVLANGEDCGGRFDSPHVADARRTFAARARIPFELTDASAMQTAAMSPAKWYLTE